jgi:hypothetical protein
MALFFLRKGDVAYRQTPGGWTGVWLLPSLRVEVLSA